MTNFNWNNDPRWAQVGELIVHNAVDLQPGEKVMIAMSETASYPLLEAVYRACVRAGGYPQVQFLSEHLQQVLLEDGDAQQIGWVPRIEEYGMEWADAYIALRGAFPLSIHNNVPSDRMSLAQKAHGIISTKRWKETKWSLIRVPNQDLADEAGVSLEQVADMFFDACLIDWPASKKQWDSWAEQLDGSHEVRIEGRYTNLTFSVQDRRWLAWADGRNMPDGEIATAPVTDTVNGTIWFENPGVFGGRLFHDLTLTWDHGTLIEATSSTNQDFLHMVLDTDSGAKSIGEFGIGVNPAIDMFCNDILLDEKILGTVHIALGRAYPECGGTNESAIHWDIIKDIRKEGRLVVDGKTVVEGGKVLL
ncbi:aminopeptidase [Bifidobacterium cebidarum]|uniref:Peptidase M29 n=1 Tax=Bifidobacterium cebidarum TaxID=2650773 RepID=A0A6I1G9A2_9BIFI|nr:aminopeptidase [Bifidobacterium cebidarum]KAB7788110.1 peptidase M29 [Bifidobacterium cebidarum]